MFPQGKWIEQLQCEWIQKINYVHQWTWRNVIPEVGSCLIYIQDFSYFFLGSHHASTSSENLKVSAYNWIPTLPSVNGGCNFLHTVYKATSNIHVQLYILKTWFTNLKHTLLNYCSQQQQINNRQPINFTNYRPFFIARNLSIINNKALQTIQ